MPGWSKGNDFIPLISFGNWNTSSTSPCGAIFPFDRPPQGPILVAHGIRLMTIKQVEEKVSGAITIGNDEVAEMLDPLPDNYPTASDLSYKAAYELATDPARHNELFNKRIPGLEYPTRNFWDFIIACEKGEESIKAPPNRKPY